MTFEKGLDSLRENDKIIREMIRHEDTNINNRVGWSITAQAFLFTALRFANDLNKPSECTVDCSKTSSSAQLSFTMNEIIPLLGITIAALTLWGVMRGIKARADLLDWHKVKQINKLDLFPTVIGRQPCDKEHYHWYCGFISPNFILPLVLLITWFYICPSSVSCAAVIIGLLFFIAPLIYFIKS